MQKEQRKINKKKGGRESERKKARPSSRKEAKIDHNDKKRREYFFRKTLRRAGSMSEFQTSESSGSRDEGIQREGGLRDKKKRDESNSTVAFSFSLRSFCSACRIVPCWLLTNGQDIVKHRIDSLAILRGSALPAPVIIDHHFIGVMVHAIGGAIDAVYNWPVRQARSNGAVSQ